MKRHRIRIGQTLLVVMASLLLAPLAQAGDTSPPQATVELIVTNAQGTIVAKMTPQGQVTYTAAYRPYGQQAQGAPQPGPGYTGHVNDPTSGLVYMQQRYYDPEIGRFISPDPIAPTPGNIYNFNRYAYANNNPYRYIDPDGRCPKWGDAKAICEQAKQREKENQRIKAFGGGVMSYVRKFFARRKRSVPRFIVAGSYPNGYGKVYIYQLVDKSGKAITDDGYSVKENIYTVFSGVHKGVSVGTSHDRFVSMRNGRGYDRVGPRYAPNPINHYTMTAIQTFIIKYQGKITPLPTVLKHTVKVDAGQVLMITTTDVTP